MSVVLALAKELARAMGCDCEPEIVDDSGLKRVQHAPDCALSRERCTLPPPADRMGDT